MPVNGINAGELRHDRYSGTRLFTVLNIKDFSCFALQAIPFKGMKNRRRSGIPTRPCYYECSPVL